MHKSRELPFLGGGFTHRGGLAVRPPLWLLWVRVHGSMGDRGGAADRNCAPSPIENPRSALWHVWGEYIVKIGTALRESREQHGADWAKVYDSLGYAFSHEIACQYVLCARYQDAADFHHTLRPQII